MVHKGVLGYAKPGEKRKKVKLSSTHLQTRGLGPQRFDNPETTDLVFTEK